MGTDEFVVNALKLKSEALKGLTDVMLRYPNAQARRQLHKSRYNAKVNYWLRLRSRFPTQTLKLTLKTLLMIFKAYKRSY